MKPFVLRIVPLRVLWGLLYCSLILSCTLLIPTQAYANSDTLETRVRAAFLFNFARYTEWPTASDSTDSSFRFCVAQSQELEQALQQTLQSKKIFGLTPSIQLLQHTKRVSECRLLYLPDLPQPELQAWLQAASDMDILVISEGRDFPKTYPGMVGFFLLDGRIRFAINPTHVKQSGLQMSSRLLGLADIISGEK
ncbi:MAG: YfiR family protein [Oceanococcus sp.]